LVPNIRASKGVVAIFTPRIITNKNSPLGLYVLDFCLTIDLLSMELEGMTGRKDMTS
jgi:hypothetical protein